AGSGGRVPAHPGSGGGVPARSGSGGRAPGRGNGAVKAKRQQAILSLVSRERLASQEEIRARLAAMGLEATQSTISRDIEELGLARVHDREGVRYVVPGRAAPGAPTRLLRHLLDEFALAFVPSGNLLVIRTPPGAANALAEGVDRAELPEVAGTVAGDDTILVVAAEGWTGRRVERRFRELMEEG
ncbi:MAG TPA: arginine repressor, partial [Actinomycetota bacterium]|nr:arginine repressor [Actinomycetota bacterium]